MGELMRKLKKALGILKDFDKTKVNLRWMYNQAHPYRWQILLVLLINLLGLAMSFTSTIIGKYVVDEATTKGNILTYALIMGAVSLFNIGFSMVTQLFSAYINERFTFGLRTRVFDDIQRGAWQKLTSYHSGDLMTRLTSDISSVSGGIISLVPNIIALVFQLVAAFFILFYYDKSLALFALLLGPLGAISMLIFREKYEKYQRELRENESEYRSYMQESLSHITVTKAFQLENDANQTIKGMRDRRLKSVMASTRISMYMNAMMRITFRAGYVVAFCWGAYRIFLGDITYGTMTLFLSLVSQVQSPLSNLAHILPQVFSMLISTERIREVSEIEREPEAIDAPIPEHIGLIMENVNFAYAETPVLTNVNFCLNPGERVGIVGSSGAGKTTLVRLILALVPCDARGSIRFTCDQGDSEPASASTRRLISYVPQGNTLMAGSIAKNLLCGNKHATEQDMWRALEDADAADFVRQLPEQLNTPVSEHAGGLSEGQAQRIAIARALIRARPLLILDEATSALDEATEARVLKRVTSREGRACLIITHRRSMLRYCDRVLEIDDDGRATLSAPPVDADGREA